MSPITSIAPTFPDILVSSTTEVELLTLVAPPLTTTFDLPPQKRPKFATTSNHRQHPTITKPLFPIPLILNQQYKGGSLEDLESPLFKYRYIARTYSATDDSYLDKDVIENFKTPSSLAKAMKRINHISSPDSANGWDCLYYVTVQNVYVKLDCLFSKEKSSRTWIGPTRLTYDLHPAIWYL